MNEFNEEKIDIITQDQKTNLNSQGDKVKKDDDLMVKSSGDTNFARGSENHLKDLQKDNQPLPDKKKNKALWIMGTIGLIILLIDITFIAYFFSAKEFNPNVNLDNPVNVNPTNNYTILNNQTIVVDVDPDIMDNIMKNISAIRGNLSQIKEKLNITN